MTTLNILNQLSATTKGTEKLAILKANKDNTVLMEFFRLALDPLITFGIKKIPSYTEQNSAAKYALMESFQDLQKLARREITGNSAIDFLAHILMHSDADDAECIERIIAKDPKCGVAESIANKVWPGLIFDFPVMKASPHDEKSFDNIEFPAFSQTKLDGARCCIMVDEKGAVTALSSSGREIMTHGYFEHLGKFANSVFDGELLMKDETGNFMERKAGNGIVNRALKGTIPPNQAKNLHFVVFDYIPLNNWKQGKYNVDYKSRAKYLTDIISTDLYNVSLVETRVVKSEEEAMKHFREHLDKGLEGTIVKDMKSIWEGKRRKDHIKLKGIISCDLRVVGVEEGTGKNIGKIGALVCESADGLVKVNVGTGLTDADRAKDPNEFLNFIVEIGYNERIRNKNEGSTWSLFLPRFYRIRLDKTVADSLDNIPLKG